MPAVAELRLLAVDLPFKVAFRHAAATRETSESVFLRLRLDNGVEGWGECLPRRYVSGEHRDDAFALLRDAILPALAGRSFASVAEVAEFLAKCDGKAPPDWVAPEIPQTSAWCAVDLALLDAFGRHDGAPVRLGPEGPVRPRYSGVVSAGTGRSYVTSLLKLRAFGFQHVKLKVERDGGPEAARTARRVLGRRADLRADANMAWDTGQALDAIRELRTAGIESIEQPVAAGDLDALARLVAESGAGIMVDEGLTDRDSLRALIERRACTAVNIRISKCGGLLAAAARCREALDAGLTLQVGCQVGESSLLSAAQMTLLAALAPLRPGVRWAEGAFGRHLLREDPGAPLVQFRFGGRAPHRPPGPGLGVRIDQELLQRHAVAEARIV